MTDMLVAPDLRALTDDDLAALYDSSGDDTRTAVLAEMGRRDRADRLAKARGALAVLRAEGECAAYAQYRDADQVCRGELLSREGKAAGITDEQVLWRMPAEQAQRFASEELRDYWLYVAPRITPAAYVRQRAAQARAERMQHLDRNGGNHDREHGDTGTGLAEPDAGALRPDETAGEAPQAGPGRAVQRGGSHPLAASDTDHDGPPGRRPGGPVQHGRVNDQGEGGDMGLIYDGFRIAQQAAESHGKAQAQAAQDRQAAQLAAEAAALDAEVHGPGRIVPGEAADHRDDYTPGDLRFVLDETAELVARYVSCTPAQADAMTIYAAATNALQASPAFGEMLFTAKTEQAGKTTAMAVTAALCVNPVNAKGTMPALQSALAAATNEPERPAPVLYYDEISGLYGESGLNRGGNWVLDDVLRDGYKNGATRKWSVNRAAQEFSIHVPVLMTGRGTSLPRDIRSRTIVIAMEPAAPKAYFDMREAEPEARALAACLAQAVASRIGHIAEFRARGIHPQLAGRKLEVWEPLFAVAYILGGQEWLNRCLAAFRELAIAEAEQVTLTPRQQVLRDAARILDGPLAGMAATGFVGGLALADEMRRLDNPLYAARSEAGMAKLISDAMPVPTTQKRVDGKPVRGYFAHEITQAWEAVRPASMEDASIPEEDNPFAVTDDTDEDESGDIEPAHTGEAGVTGESAESGLR